LFIFLAGWDSLTRCKEIVFPLTRINQALQIGNEDILLCYQCGRIVGVVAFASVYHWRSRDKIAQLDGGNNRLSIPSATENGETNSYKIFTQNKNGFISTNVISDRLTTAARTFMETLKDEDHLPSTIAKHLILCTCRFRPIKDRKILFP